MRRVRWAAGIIVLMLVVSVLVGWSSRRCLIVVYNDAPEPREGVSIQAPGLQWRLQSLPSWSSRTRTVSSRVPEGTFIIHLGRAGDLGHELWFAPSPGHRLIVRVSRDGLIDTQVIEPWWDRLPD